MQLRKIRLDLVIIFYSALENILKVFIGIFYEILTVDIFVLCN